MFLKVPSFSPSLLKLEEECEVLVKLVEEISLAGNS